MHKPLIVLAALLSGMAGHAAELNDYCARAPFPIAPFTEPSFPGRTFAITDYGAVGDGRTVCTRAIAQAIAACSQAGGGHVVLPRGIWLTGPIVLQSHVDLHVERGAILQFTGDHTAYPLVPREGRGYQAQSALTAHDATDVAVTGDGIIDGAGDTWRPIRRSKLTAAQWDAYLASGGVTSGDDKGSNWWPSKAARDGEEFLVQLAKQNPHFTAEEALPARDFLRSHLVVFTRCRRVLVSGVTIRNSPSGIYGPDGCTDIVIRDATLENDWWAQNGDGMDINNCRHAAVFRCTLSTGDDAICMKAGGKNPFHDSEAGLANLVVAECTVYRGHGGFVVGGTTETGMDHLWCTHCDFIGTDTGIRVKSGLGHGGLAHHIQVDHILMRDIVNEAITFNSFYDNAPVSAAKDAPKLSRDPGRTPEFRDFLIQDVTCVGAGAAISITGMHQSPIHRVRIENAEITARRGFKAVDAADIVLKHVVIHSTEGAPRTETSTKNIRFED